MLPLIIDAFAHAVVFAFAFAFALVVALKMSFVLSGFVVAHAFFVWFCPLPLQLSSHSPHPTCVQLLLLGHSCSPFVFAFATAFAFVGACLLRQLPLQLLSPFSRPLL